MTTKGGPHSSAGIEARNVEGAVKEHVHTGRRAVAEIGTRRDIARTGQTPQRKIGRTANEPDTGYVAPTADQEIGLVTAAALSYTTAIQPGPPEGPGMEAVTTIAYRLVNIKTSPIC